MQSHTHEHEDTWTHISVAAERVLAEVEKVEEQRAHKQPGADHGANESSENGEDADHCSVAVVVMNRKRSSR
jgi:hypothetical protein